MKNYKQSKEQLLALLLQYASACQNDQYGTEQESLDELAFDLLDDVKKFLNS